MGNLGSPRIRLRGDRGKSVAGSSDPNVFCCVLPGLDRELGVYSLTLFFCSLLHPFPLANVTKAISRRPTQAKENGHEGSLGVAKSRPVRELVVFIPVIAIPSRRRKFELFLQ